MTIDYRQVLRVIMFDKDPFAALESFVTQEREAAWHEGHQAHGPVSEFGDTPCDCRNPHWGK